MMRIEIWIAALLIISRLSIAGDVIERSPDLPASAPWDLVTLSKSPSFEWLDVKSSVRSLFYAGGPYKDRPTRVFAYYASPSTLRMRTKAEASHRYPAVVLVHGGGGTAFREWVELWAKRGYAAIAMDLAGMRPVEGVNAHDAKNRTPLDDGGPSQGEDAKFKVIDLPVTEHWCYHAVSNVILAHSLIRGFDEVDKARTAVTGISWGGYLTCIVASLDNRFRAAVPVYGCGFLHENSVWKPNQFDKFTPEQRTRWVSLYDPSQALRACRVPIFFVNGTNDFAYPLDSYMKSYELVSGPKNIRVSVNMPHGHLPGWAPAEIGAFIDQHLIGIMALPQLLGPRNHNGSPSVVLVSEKKVVSASLHFTAGIGPINQRQWTTQPAIIGEREITAAPVPADATAWFFTATDERGLVVSSEVVLRDSDLDFHQIFDGKSLEGWKAADMSFWSVQDDAITGTITPEHVPATNQYLIWQDSDVRDFELKLSFRLKGSTRSGANGGFQFRSRQLENQNVVGYQVDNEFGHDWKVRLYDEHVRHTLAFQGKRTEYDAKGQFHTSDLPSEASSPHFQLDEWHDYHLIAIGARMTLKVNGLVVAEVFDRDPARFEPSGILALQLRTGPPVKAQFKNLRVRRL